MRTAHAVAAVLLITAIITADADNNSWLLDSEHQPAALRSGAFVQEAEAAVAQKYGLGKVVLNWKEVHNLYEESRKKVHKAKARRAKNLNDHPVLKKIIQLKAWCRAAYDKTKDPWDVMQYENGAKHSSFIPFVQGFGDPKKRGNPVLEYAHVMAKLRRRWKIGVGRYFLTQINKAILRPKAKVLHFNYPHHGYVTLARLTIGTTGYPMLLEKLAVNMAKYANEMSEQERADMQEQKKNCNSLKCASLIKKKGITQVQANRLAALVWLKKGAHGKYENFLQRESGMWHRRVKRAHHKVVAAALRAAGRAFKRAKRKKVGKKRLARKMVHPAWRAADRAKGRYHVRVPSLKAQKKAAKARAARWLKRHKRRLKRKSHGVKSLVRGLIHSSNKKRSSCAKPRAPSVKGYRLVACGDCDTKYFAPFGRKWVGLKKCAATCRKYNCKRFSYGTKTAEGKPALGCHISKGKGRCPKSVTRYCRKGFKIGKKWGAKKTCCSQGACGKINYWGGHMYEPTAANKKIIDWKSVPLKCKTSTAKSNRAGIVRVGLARGYKLVGGGLNNRYRSFNSKSGFEESYPEGNNWRCDTGFGPGKLTCYSRMCKLNGFKCLTRSASRNGSGTATATLPAGYVATGGGLYNHYRGWNKKSAFEESMPYSNNAWRCDMGIGAGKFQCFVRGCKSTAKRKRLRCITKKSSVANYHNPRCPPQYTVTGCGMNERKRRFNKLSAFEQVGPFKNNGCVCDSGFGKGANVCYARCCKVQVQVSPPSKKNKGAKKKKKKKKLEALSQALWFSDDAWDP